LKREMFNLWNLSPDGKLYTTIHLLFLCKDSHINVNIHYTYTIHKLYTNYTPTIHQLFYDYIQSWKTGEGCVKDCEGLTYYQIAI
jgi:UV DNA damage repair endonuclease